MDCRISIITPCYNASKSLIRCINSVVAQTFFDWELIIINDGSTDNSLDICKKFVLKDSRVKVFSKENGGVSSARNFGLHKANGTWITFLDADDTLPQNALQYFMELVSMEDGNQDIIYGGYNVVGNKPSLNIISRCCKTSIQMLANELFRASDYPYQGYVWSKLFKKEIIMEHDICFDERIMYNEDRLFVFKYLSCCSSGVYSTFPVYNYYQTGGGAMDSINGPNFWKFETDLDAFVKMCQIINDNTPSELVESVYHATYVSYLKNKRLNKEFGNNKKSTNRRLRKKLFSAVPYFRVKAFELNDFKVCWKIRVYNIAVKFGLKHQQQ